MSAFYIGQRVRVVRCYNPTLDHLNGAETVIVGRALFDEWQLALTNMGFPTSAPDECLEPISPPGLESLEEINALYEPVEVRA